MTRADRRKYIGPLLLLALLLGIAITLGERLIFAMALNRSVDLDEVDVLAQSAALTAIPFLCLAFRARLLPWLVALSATIAVHGWWLAKGISYQMARDGTGVDMSGALLMLLSPFAIVLLTWALSAAMSQRRDGG